MGSKSSAEDFFPLQYLQQVRGVGGGEERRSAKLQSGSQDSFTVEKIKNKKSSKAVSNEGTVCGKTSHGSNLWGCAAMK